MKGDAALALTIAKRFEDSFPSCPVSFRREPPRGAESNASSGNEEASRTGRETAQRTRSRRQATATAAWQDDFRRRPARATEFGAPLCRLDGQRKASTR